MSTHSESIRFLGAVIEMVNELVQAQQQVRLRVGQTTDTLALALSDTSIGADLDQVQAAIGERCDEVTRALVAFAEMLGTIRLQMQQMGGM